MTSDTFESRTIEIDGHSLVGSVTSRVAGFGKLTADEKQTVEDSLVRFVQLRADAMFATPARMKSIEREMGAIDTTLATIFQRVKGRTWEQTKQLAISLLIEGLKVAL